MSTLLSEWTFVHLIPCKNPFIYLLCFLVAVEMACLRMKYIIQANGILKKGHIKPNGDEHFFFAPIQTTLNKSYNTYYYYKRAIHTEIGYFFCHRQFVHIHLIDRPHVYN